MALLKIARMGHPVLLRVAEPVADPTAPEVRRLVADMFDTMADAGGIGLAAPQVHVPWRLFVFAIPAERTGDAAVPPMVLINPEVEAVGEEVRLGVEGCLSIPGLRGVVPRAARVRFRGVDCDGALIEGEADGLAAVVIQHEFDHLNGVLYPMRIEDFSLFGFIEELERAAEA